MNIKHGTLSNETKNQIDVIGTQSPATAIGKQSKGGITPENRRWRMVDPSA